MQYTYDCIFLERGLVTRKCDVYPVVKSNGDESSQRHKGQKAVVVSNAKGSLPYKVNRGVCLPAHIIYYTDLMI